MCYVCNWLVAKQFRCNDDLSLFLFFLSLTLSLYLPVCLSLCQTSLESHCSAGNALIIQTAGLYTLELTL